WRRALIVLAVLAAVAGTVVLYRSPLLRVQEVQVVNATSTSPERIAELADLEGASMFNTPLDEAEARIVALPLVKGVQVQRRWPNKVRIEVIERTRWGYWDLAGTSYVIDSEGVILANVQPPEDAPVIHDVGDPANLSPGDHVDADAVRLAQALLKLVPDQFALRITKFEYTLEKGLSVVTDANYRVVMGDSQNVEYKLAVWKTMEEEIGREAMAGHVLDLRFRDRPSFQ
ncbi:MAG: FtsQ-type POTRA domain-containing protein, partial [Chloroflexi bacterium]|nr:FtsQ-type POTRA domain-containing protein [Chloroflexota bacterium]